MDEMTQCPVCGKEYDASLPNCPHCEQGQNERPSYQPDSTDADATCVDASNLADDLDSAAALDAATVEDKGAEGENAEAEGTDAESIEDNSADECADQAAEGVDARAGDGLDESQDDDPETEDKPEEPEDAAADAECFKVDDDDTANEVAGDAPHVEAAPDHVLSDQPVVVQPSSQPSLEQLSSSQPVAPSQPPEEAGSKTVTFTMNKRVIIMAVAAVVIVAVGIAAYFGMKAEEEKKAFNSYVTKMELVATNMLSSGADAESTCNEVKRVWGSAIYNDYRYEWDDDISEYYSTDFNTSLALYYSDYMVKLNIDSIQSSQESVTEDMKDLAGPPEGCETAYATLNSLYQNYYELTNLAISPSGSLTTFNSTFSDCDSDFMKDYNLLKTQIPNKK